MSTIHESRRTWMIVAAIALLVALIVLVVALYGGGSAGGGGRHRWGWERRRLRLLSPPCAEGSAHASG